MIGNNQLSDSKPYRLVYLIMATYEPTAADVAEWTGGANEEQLVDLQAQADRQQQRSFDRAQVNLSARQTTQGVMDHLSHSDHKLFELSQARNKAEAEGNFHEQQRIEAILDGIVAGDLQVPGAAPAAKTAAPKAAEEPQVTDPEVDENEQLTENFRGSEILERVSNADGIDRSEAVMRWMNENSSEQDIRTFMGADADDASLVYEVAKLRMDQENSGIQPAETASFDETLAQQLTDQYGHKASQVVELSNAVGSGQLTQAQAMAQAAQDPTLLAVAAQMLQSGAVSFASK